MTDEVDIVESDAASRETLARAKTNRISLVARACQQSERWARRARRGGIKGYKVLATHSNISNRFLPDC